MTMSTSPKERSALWFGLGAVGLWSTVATAFEFALDHLTPLQLLWISSIVSWLFFSAAVVYRQPKRLAKGWLRAGIAGCVNPVLYYLVLFSAYARLPGQEAMALNYTWALTMTLLALPILGHRPKALELLACAISYAGVWVIATRGQVFSLGFADLTGVLFALFSTTLWALYWLFNAKDPRPPLTAQWQNFTVAWPILTILVLLSGEDWRLDRTSAVGAACYVGLFEMGLAFLLWQEAMRRTESTARIANLIFLSPPASLSLLYLVKGEELLPSTFTGLLLILAGLAIQAASKTKLRKAPAHSPRPSASV